MLYKGGDEYPCHERVLWGRSTTFGKGGWGTGRLLQEKEVDETPERT
ncbi:hypothetical protein GCM10011389_24810 [Pontibacillus salipaludis]|uniref:Uncharacterized protein n=1 Tax=Pontibacillus salipaludis TaxID=1697394 RepID=A0ABQ1Q855_9BACI|nr:hypothetical protein GCM10011389_24810 [Pontibacillus salipaludis]